MPPTLPARRRSWHTSPRTSSARPPMRSRPPALPLRKESAKAQGNSSVGGSATSSRRRFATSSSMTSGLGTTSAGGYSTAESASGQQHCQGRQGHVHTLTTAALPDEQHAGPTRLTHLCCQRPPPATWPANGCSSVDPFRGDQPGARVERD